MQFHDLAVGLIHELGEREQVVHVLAVGGVPVAFAVAVAPLEGDAVEGAFLGRTLPDGRVEESEPELRHGGLCGFDGLMFW